MRERNAIAIPGLLMVVVVFALFVAARLSVHHQSRRGRRAIGRHGDRQRRVDRACGHREQRLCGDPAQPGGGRRLPGLLSRNRPPQRVHLDVAPHRATHRLAAGQELRQPDPQGQRRRRQPGRGRGRRRVARRRHGEGGLRRRGLRGVRQDPDRDGRASHGQPLSVRQLRGRRLVPAGQRGRGDRLAPSGAPGAPHRSPGSRCSGRSFAASPTPRRSRPTCSVDSRRMRSSRPARGSWKAPLGWSRWRCRCSAKRAS